MDDLMIFKNDEFGEIQIIEEKGKFEFGATEVAKMLGYANPHKAIIDHCKKDGLTKREVIDNLGRKQEKNFISEGNLYRLITHSKLPDAEKFESWVYDEVLPSIRNHGAYMTSSKIEEVLLNPDTIIQLATDLKNERAEKERLKIENDQQHQLIGELKPKADYTDKILQSKGTVKVNVIANDYGLTAIAMNKILHKLGIQYKQGSDWLLYRKYREKGYTHSKTIHFYHKDGTPDTSVNMEWTQKGRLFLYEMLKQNGIVPMIEKQLG